MLQLRTSLDDSYKCVEEAHSVQEPLEGALKILIILSN